MLAIFKTHRALRLENTELKKQIQQLQKELADATKKIGLLTEQTQYLTKQVKTLTSDNRTLSNANYILEGEKEDLVEMNSNLNHEITELNKKIDNHVCECKHEDEVSNDEIVVGGTAEAVGGTFSDDFLPSRRNWQEEAKLLAKELLYCWMLRSNHPEDRNKSYTESEWNSVKGSVCAGLSSYSKECMEDGADLGQINYLLRILKVFKGRL